MNYSRLELFAGKPIKTSNNHLLYSPTIQEIVDIGESQYFVYVAFATFDENKIFKIILNIDGKSKNELLDSQSVYDYLVQFSDTTEYLCRAFSFFAKKTVTYNEETLNFELEGSLFLSEDNISEIVEAIKVINVARESGESEVEADPVFANERAREMYLEIKAIEQKNKETSDGYLDMKDMLSILCNAEGNGINIFNVFNLTYYQFREQFERMNMKESHKRLMPIWANNRTLDDKFQLPEWMKKT